MHTGSKTRVEDASNRGPVGGTRPNRIRLALNGEAVK